MTDDFPFDHLDDAPDQIPAAKIIEAEPIPMSQSETPEQALTPRDNAGLKSGAALIPVGERGAMPENFAQQIDYAQYMAKAAAAVPSHLRHNVGACLAVMDIAQRAGGLSPYMVANKTYVQNDRLCFESQLFHALAERSGLLSGPLRARFEGDGDERTCIVWGYLKGESQPHEYTSPPLKTLHPGHTVKNGQKYVKGSPLWDRKPDVQLFYDTARDWIRMYCPLAVLGIYSPEEIARGEAEMLPAEPRDVTPLSARLDNTQEEGFVPGHVARELASIKTGKQTILPAKAEAIPAEAAEAKPALETTVARPAERKPKPRAPKVAPPKRRPVKTPTIIDSAPPEKSATQRRAELEQAAAPNGQPRTAAEYALYAEQWISEATNYDEARKRYDEDERSIRDELQVPIETRRKLSDKLDNKFLD